MNGLASGKTEYTEAETATALGITMEELRKLVRQHVTQSEEDINNIPVMTFRPSDLLMLRMLAEGALEVRVSD
jgi:hypothetical protein